MDGYQILIYIVVAIVYFILKGVNKAGKADIPDTTVGEGDNPAFPQNAPPRKTDVPTLQDLLNEFGEVTRKTKKQAQIPTPEVATLDPKTDKRSFYEVAQEKATEQKRKAEVKAKQTAKKVQAEKERREAYSYEQSLEEEYVPVYDNKANLVDYEDPTKSAYEGLDDHRKRFVAFDIQETSPNVFAQLLKDPQSARTAFIMTEIFKRKYE
jgi:uncharacterized FlaG/YvyC family protein